MIKLLLLLAMATLLLAKEYTNCNLQNKHYEDICVKAVKNGVPYSYANEFLLSYFKTKKFDEVSWKYLQPSQIKAHAKSEKKANNTLSKYVHVIVKNLQDYKEVYDCAEKKYGVNREVVAALLMKETRLGKIQPTHDAFIVFNTIVTRTPTPTTSREKWLLNIGKTNMVTIITYCYKKGLQPESCNFPSSYAGAVGIPQFMPENFCYIDGYKKEVGNLTRMEDAIMSASNYLNKKADFTKLIEWDKIPDMAEVESAWYKFDNAHENGSFVYAQSKKSAKTYDCFSCGKSELAYLRDYTQKIMSYNNSSNYAVGVLRLAYDAHQALSK